MDDLVVTVKTRGDYSSEYTQWLEESFDKALIPMGYSRSGTDKLTDKVVLKYRQFANLNGTNVTES